MKGLLILEKWSAAEDIVLLAFRLFVGAFLIWGVWDNIVSAERMREFSAFLEARGFAYPQVLARVSVWAQFGCGAGFVLGLLTRLCGIVCGMNFIVAVVMVDAEGGFRQAFPAAMLVMFGLYLAARGAGRYSLDAFWIGPAIATSNATAIHRP